MSCTTQTSPQNSLQKKVKKNLEDLYEVLAPGSNILKVSPTTSTIKEPGKAVVTVRNSDIAKFGTVQERHTPLKVYAVRRGQRTCEKLVEGQIQSHIKQLTCKIKGDKKMKHRKRDLSSGVSSSRSNISRAMRGSIQKIPSFAAIKNQHNEKQTASTSGLILPAQTASLLALQHVAPAASTSQGKRISDRNHSSP